MYLIDEGVDFHPAHQPQFRHFRYPKTFLKVLLPGSFALSQTRCSSSKQTWDDLIDFLHFQILGEAANASYATAVGDGTKHALYGTNTSAASNVALD